MEKKRSESSTATLRKKSQTHTLSAKHRLQQKHTRNKNRNAADAYTEPARRTLKIRWARVRRHRRGRRVRTAVGATRRSAGHVDGAAASRDVRRRGGFVCGRLGRGHRDDGHVHFARRTGGLLACVVARHVSGLRRLGLGIGALAFRVTGWSRGDLVGRLCGSGVRLGQSDGRGCWSAVLAYGDGRVPALRDLVRGRLGSCTSVCLGDDRSDGCQASLADVDK